MASRADTIDLSQLAPVARRRPPLDVDVAPGRLSYGGQAYEVEGGTVRGARRRLADDVGYALRLRFDAALAGPCVRCLEPAAPGVEVDAREVDAAPTPASEDDLRSPYVDRRRARPRGLGPRRARARDAREVPLPPRLRRPVRGLRRVAQRRRRRPSTRHESAPDPRWDKLRELKFE